MMLKNIILGVILLLFSAPLTAQGKYALSLDDYMNDTFTAVDGLRMTSRSKSKSKSKSKGVWNGEADFVPSTGDNELDELLKKKAKFIIYKDTLYVNCLVFRFERTRVGKGYAPGFRYDTNKIAFITKTVRRNSPVVFVGGAFGMVGVAVTSVATSALETNRTCYLISSNEKDVSNFDRYSMMSALIDYPELLKAYKDEPKEKQESAAMVIEYLNKAGLLSRY